MDIRTLEQMLQKARAAKGIVKVFALAMDDENNTFEGPEFALAMLEADNLLDELTSSMAKALNGGD
jgi:hypothetical protein